MKHASALSLETLSTLLESLRGMPELRERTPGSFYRTSHAFLHFHEDPAGLFADVKLDLNCFTRVPVNSPADRKALLQLVEAAIRNATR